MKIKIYTDGGSRGNPGEAAIGVVAYNKEDGSRLTEIKKAIGVATNNIAEYTAVLEALDWVINTYKQSDLEFYLDSELVVRQLSGIYKVKDPNLKVIYLKIRQKIIELGSNITFESIPREKNKEADALVNEALDALKN